VYTLPEGKALFGIAGTLTDLLTAVAYLYSAFGPDLSAIGARRSLRYLRESVVDPSADVPLAYRAVTVTTAAGTKIRGIHLNEDDYSIQLRDGNGDPRSFLKDDLQGINYETESLMPSYRSLSAADLDNLMAYLNSLRGKSE
jgi:putative heme-binding domain-containing protein